jgi:hypothetical protein
MLARGLIIAAFAMFFVSLVFASVPFAVGGLGLAMCAAILKELTNED